MPQQRETLAHLKKSTDLVILQSEKSIGPGIVNRETYTKQFLTEHLLHCIIYIWHPSKKNRELIPQTATNWGIKQKQKST